jgi:hypothetical protein
VTSLVSVLNDFYLLIIFASSVKINKMKRIQETKHCLEEDEVLELNGAYQEIQKSLANSFSYTPKSDPTNSRVRVVMELEKVCNNYRRTVSTLVSPSAEDLSTVDPFMVDPSNKVDKDLILVCWLVYVSCPRSVICLLR